MPRRPAPSPGALAALAALLALAASPALAHAPGAPGEPALLRDVPPLGACPGTAVVLPSSDPLDPVRLMGSEVAAWYFDERDRDVPALGTTRDATGNGLDAIGANASAVVGMFEAGMRLRPQVASSLRVPAAPGLAVLAGDFTLSFWIRTNSTSTVSAWTDAPAIVDRAGGEPGGLAVILDAGRVGFVTANASGDAGVVWSVAKVNNGYWHHVALTRNASSGEKRVYVGASLSGASNQTTGSLGGAGDLFLGARGGTSNFLDASLDTVRLHAGLVPETWVRTFATFPYGKPVACVEHPSASG